MDDCNLEKLTIKPGKLSPVFKMSIIDYTVTLASNIEKLTIDYMTRDSGASCVIIGSGGSRTLSFEEGKITDVKLEVTAEDGKTTKTYLIKVKRLSAKDATLTGLKISSGKLEPDFSSDVTSYTCSLAANTTSLIVTPTAPDVKCDIKVNGAKPGDPSPLNVGDSKINVEVTSVDRSNKETYSIIATKKQVPRYVKFSDPCLALAYECPVSLSALYRPVSIRGSDPKHTFSGPIIDEFTKTSKVDPLNEMPLDSDWRIPDFELEKKMSQAVVSVPLVFGGSSDAVKFGELGGHLEKCNKTPKVQEGKFQNAADKPKHTVEIRAWEKQLHQIYDETDPDKLTKAAEDFLQKYYASLPTPGQTRRYAEGESPIDLLTNAIYCYAVAIKSKPKEARHHLNLAMVLEEKYIAEDRYGLKQEESYQAAGLNMSAQESSKDEEVDAICKLRGVGPNAPLALKLKAVDEEFHHLLDTKNPGADHVQQLYAWKAKQASQEGAAAQKATSDDSPLGQAYLKYLDALVLDDAKAVYSFHVGRFLVVQGEFDEAVKRLETALSWNANFQMARFYLGLALALKKGGPGTRAKEAIAYLQEGMELLLAKCSEEALRADDTSTTATSLAADNLMSIKNVHFLRGILQLGKLLQKNTDVKDAMTPSDVFHTAALLSSQALPTLSRGDGYQQMEWVLLDAHTLLLEQLSANPKGNEGAIKQRCERLSALVKRCTIPQNAELLSLQEKTCQKMIVTNPCNSHSLYLLGCAQLSQCENTKGDEAENLREQAMKSFKASIVLEGKPASGDAPAEVKEQKWWQDRVKAEEEKQKAVAAKATPTRGGAPPARGGATPRGGARGAPARGAPAARGRGAAAAPAKAAPVRGGAAAKPAPARGALAKAPARGAARGATTAAKPGSAAKKPSSASSTSSTHKCTSVAKVEETKPAEPAATDAPAAPTKAGPINRKTYHARLGLARALAKNTNDMEESKKYYNEVITMAPEVHDAYIEVAEMLTATDPMGAVDIYCKFPVPDEPTFDDAYIFGEIVRLTFKAEKYDHPKLAANMIALGRVMGLPILEKYVKILEDKFKNDMLMKVYAGVNGRSVDDEEMQGFFRAKCWM
ncbi:uncharacterized protein LOC135485620 [Lineus longissimus]|uniref:uncharacterized protein LOC135485620 n=1 Tax=Lineus longissimus TaxID=88925 RepID=UPI002B4D90B4